MGENWRDCQAYKKHNSELTADAGSEELRMASFDVAASDSEAVACR
jgi:hypothetical protein